MNGPTHDTGSPGETALESVPGDGYSPSPLRPTTPEVPMRDGSPWNRTAAWLPGLASLLLPLVCLAVGCHSLNFLRPGKEKDAPPAAAAADAPRLPGKYQVRVAPVIFLSDFELPKDLPLFAELGQMRDAIQKELLLPPASDPVKVYLFETEKAYTAYMKSVREYKDLPDRRAFFVAQPRGLSEDLLVYTYWSKRIRQDLRHELTHALLHSVIKEVPQWLDEGLAEFFELPPEKKGTNAEHVERLRADLATGKARLDLPRLEGLTQVDEMRPAEYRESWAWVHLMLRGSPEARLALLSYLQQLRGMRHPGPLAPRLEKVFKDGPTQALKEHLTQLDATLTRERAEARP